MADVLSAAPAGATTRETAAALVGMRRSLQRHSQGGSGTVLTLRVTGLLLAVATLLGGLVRYDDPGRWVDLLATLFLGWLVGWVMGPIVARGAGQGLRPEWFALLPIPPRRLAAGLLGASFVGAAPAITLVAFAALPVAAARLGVLPLLVSVPAMLLQVVVVVLLSRVVVAALTATMSSRRGQELGGLLMAVVIALASGGWSLAAVMGQRLAEGPGPVLGATLRVLPSGWGPLAVEAADRSDWPLALGALGGLAVLARCCCWPGRGCSRATCAGAAAGGRPARATAPRPRTGPPPGTLAPGGGCCWPAPPARSSAGSSTPGGATPDAPCCCSWRC